MLDYRELPPLSVDEVEITEERSICGSCNSVLNYTYRIEIPSICARCIGEQLWPPGTELARNTDDIMEFVKPGPTGFQWDYLKQKHVPTHPWRPHNPYSDMKLAGVDYTPAFVDPLTPKEPLPGYHWNENLRAYMPDQNPSGYRPDPRDGRPGFGSHPREVHDYIVRNFSPTDVRMNYSEIKDELLYGPKPTVVITAEHASETENNLTAPEKPAILEDKNPAPTEPEENDVAVVLSRTEAEAAYKHAAAALAEIERLEKKYSPDMPDGSVIAFRLTFPGDSTHFSYAAIRAVGQWFATGKIHLSHPAGIGVDWSVLLECFESYGAANFEVLRTGGETAELLSGTDQRLVTLNRDAAMTAFDAQEENVPPKTVSGRGVIVNQEDDEDYDEDEH